MRQNTVKMTTAQFAELHGVNRRTRIIMTTSACFPPAKRGKNRLPLLRRITEHCF